MWRERCGEDSERDVWGSSLIGCTDLSLMSTELSLGGSMVSTGRCPPPPPPPPDLPLYSPRHSVQGVLLLLLPMLPPSVSLLSSLPPAPTPAPPPPPQYSVSELEAGRDSGEDGGRERGEEGRQPSSM